MNEKDLNDAVKVAKKSFETWSATSVEEKLELLNKMFPNLLWDAEGKHFKQTISTNPPSREDVNSLQKLLD